MREEFISEPITPVRDKLDGSMSGVGEPFFPSEFTWRKKRVTVHRMLAKWKDSGPCRMGANEQYVRRHWYDLETNEGRITIYFERQAAGKSRGQRWRIYSRMCET